MKQGNTFTFIDLFAGIGGMRKGFEAAGGKCVFTSERDIHAQTTYRANFPDDTHKIAGDITTISSEEIPVHDVLLAGFPCQPFSLAGLAARKRSGKVSGFFCPSQGSLFFEIVRILKFHRPKAFLLENVKNLMSHDRGKTGRIILQTLTIDLGYSVQMGLLNARFWVPQNRERIFIAGFQEETGFSFGPVMTHESRTSSTLRDILHPEDGTEEAEEPYTVSRKAKVSDRYTLTDTLWNSFQKHREKHRAKGNGFGFCLRRPEDIAPTLPAHYAQGGSEVLIEQKGKNPRRLTPRECARLMGFDKPGESKFQIPVSDTQAYRQFGNAVVAPLVSVIAEQMRPWLSSPSTHPCFSSSQKDLLCSGEMSDSSSARKQPYPYLSSRKNL